MLNSKKLLNLISKESDLLYEMTDDDRKKIHKILIKMYNDIFSICQKYQISLILGGGSCLGAIRHQGFIPWDDDLDLMMPRSDYNRFIEICKRGELGERYDFSYPDGITDSKTAFMKIHLKDTLNVEIDDVTTPFPKGIFIDIFPIEYAPDNKIFRTIKGIISNIIRFVYNSVLYAQYPSLTYKMFISQNSTSLKHYKFRLFVGNIFKIIHHKKWVYWFDIFNMQEKPTKYITIPTGRKYYSGEVQQTITFYPMKEVIFENVKAYIPNDYDKYLKNLYGDYMKIPPIEKRESHLVYRFKCDK